MDPSNDEESAAEDEAGSVASSVHTGRHFVDDAEWHERLQAVSVPRRYLNRLVMNYLVTEGHQQAAMHFQRESGTAPAVDLDSVQVRVDIRNAVLQGDVDLALARLRALEPAFLDSRTTLHFLLRRQQFVELVRAGRAVEALEFARRELKPLAQAHEELLAQVEETLALLAFPPEMLPVSPLCHLLDESQRREIGALVNREILAMHKRDAGEPDASIEALLRLLVHTQDDLEAKADIPVVPAPDFLAGNLL